MQKLITTIIKVSLFSLISLTALNAQINDYTNLEDLPQLKKSDTKLRVICTFSPSKNELYYTKIDSKFYGIPLMAEGITQAIPVRGSREFILYTKTENEDGEIVHTPTLTATLTGSAKEYLLILAKKKDKTMTSKVLNLSTTNLSANKVHLFNYSPVALGIQVEENKYVAQINERVSHSFKSAGRNSYTSAKVVMRYQGENKIMGSKRIRLIPGRRVIYICFASAKRAKLGATPLGMVTIQDMPK